MFENAVEYFELKKVIGAFAPTLFNIIKERKNQSFTCKKDYRGNSAHAGCCHDVSFHNGGIWNYTKCKDNGNRQSADNRTGEKPDCG